MAKASTAISEPDLTVYLLAIVHKCHDFLEMYGIFYEYRTCKKCGHDNEIQYKLIQEVIQAFGGVTGGIKIPGDKEIETVSRDITIWKGLSKCDSNSLALRKEEYANRYELTVDSVSKIRHRVQGFIDKFVTMKKHFKRGKRHEHKAHS